MAHQIEDGVAMRFEAPPWLSPEACASIQGFGRLAGYVEPPAEPGRAVLGRGRPFPL
jgi:hypothetical protein